MYQAVVSNKKCPYKSKKSIFKLMLTFIVTEDRHLFPAIDH